MHGSTNVYNEQTFATTTAPPFSAAATWAIRVNGPEPDMNFAQSQGMQGMQGAPNMPNMPGNAQPASSPFSSQGFPPAQQLFPNPGFPAQGPVSPQSQPYPQMPPNGGYSVPEPLFPQQPFPQQPFPQQGFPSIQPNAGFYPANMGNNDIALDSTNTPSTGMGNITQYKPSPVQLPGMDSGRTEGIPETPRPRLETTPEEFPSLDDPFLRDTLKHYMQRGKGAQDGEEWEET